MRPGLEGPVVGNLPPQVRAHVLGTGDDPHPAQIESICVPARTDGKIIMLAARGVPLTGILESLKIIIRQLKHHTMQHADIFRRTRTVLQIKTVILTLGVVKQRKEPYHRLIHPGLSGENPAISLNSSPVIYAMQSGPLGSAFLDHVLPEIVY